MLCNCGQLRTILFTLLAVSVLTALYMYANWDEMVAANRADYYDEVDTAYTAHYGRIKNMAYVEPVMIRP